MKKLKLHSSAAIAKPVLPAAPIDGDCRVLHEGDRTATDGKPFASGSAYLMEIYDNSRPKEPKMIAAMEYPSKEAEKIKNKIDKGGTQYTYKLVYWHGKGLLPFGN